MTDQPTTPAPAAQDPEEVAEALARGRAALTAYTATLDMGCGPETQIASLLADLMLVAEHDHDADTDALADQAADYLDEMRHRLGLD